ncbi:MAG TPA: SDR family oxidoreductase [Burkholderiaceae bacterium]|nr:SDR family oxidoreductase [Burkholderiaceae bacterium]
MTTPATTTVYTSLRDRLVFVTGGASGIGAGIVEAFVRQHSRVAFVDIDTAAAHALTARLEGLGPPALFLRCDLADIDALRAAIADVGERIGPIGVLVNNAANDERHDIDAVTPAYWDRALDINLRHLFFAAQAVRPQMRKLGGGSIVNFSSIAWMSGVKRLIAYTTAKAAIVGLTRSLAMELGDDNIRVNAIAPGAVMTEKQLRMWHTDKTTADLVARQAIHERMSEAHIAPAVLFLASDDSRLITKQCLTIDGGLR